MAVFNNGFPTSYAPMYPQMNFMPPPQPQQENLPQQQNDSGLMFVNGLNEASAWVVQPGHRAFLMDRNANTFYVKSVNENGMPNPLEIYDYKKRDNVSREEPEIDTPEYITREEFEERLAKLAPKRTTRRKKEADNESDV